MTKMWSSQSSSSMRHHQNHRSTFSCYFLLLVVFFTIYLTYPLFYISTNVAYNHKQSGGVVDVAIVVLGGGLTSDGQVPPHTQLRLDKAVSLFHQQYHDQAVIITLSGGTPHKPNPLDNRGFPVWESSAAAKKLLAMGIPSGQVYEENFSLDTVGNAYFLRAIHVEPGTFKKLVVITNSWHMPRTKAIFEKVFALPAMMSTDYPMTTWTDFFRWYRTIGVIFPGHHFYHKKDVELEFIAVESGLADDHILQARSEREMKSLQSFLHNVAPQWSSFHQLHTWLFTKHNAYASSRLIQNDKNTQVDLDALKTY